MPAGVGVNEVFAQLSFKKARLSFNRSWYLRSNINFCITKKRRESVTIGTTIPLAKTLIYMMTAGKNGRSRLATAIWV